MHLLYHAFLDNIIIFSCHSRMFEAVICREVSPAVGDKTINQKRSEKKTKSMPLEKLSVC